MAQQPDADFIALQEVLAGEYSLDREIGRGGMGVVYLAREVRLARPVAIKVLPRALAARADLRDAFLREARTAASLTHPNIVPLYAAGERGGFVYIAMAFVEGTTLGERIRSRGPLLPGQAARVLREVAWALAYAHGAGIVHRDVTAENILLERGSERALVTDFGLASAMQTSALSADGRVMGNAHYVSPEQASGEPLDARSDLYSLGIVGYYALTGRLPFDGPSSAEVVTQQLTAVAPSITSVASSVPPRLAAAVERCLHKLPVRRYRNAESFAEAIDLAFEHAREIPAPLRSWISKGEQELPARIAFMGFGAINGIGLTFLVAVSTRGVNVPVALLTLLAPLALTTGLSFTPTVSRLRRILGEGYVVDDLHSAMREHQLARADELEYERRQVSPLFHRVMRLTLAVSVGASAIGGAMIWKLSQFSTLHGMTTRAYTQAEGYAYLWMFFALSALTVSGVAVGGDYFRLHFADRMTTSAIAFWKGKWGARLGRLASLGSTHAERPAIGMPLLTEVALGRATDHLFEALPKASRRELSALPATVRQLEGDAGRLRESISRLDDQLAAFDRGGDALRDDERQRVAGELRATRAETASRLSATVSALENIRLDLLRLQLGSAGIESVTASLEAAHAIGEQIAGTIAAQAEVDRLLSPASRVAHQPGDGSSDTPRQGAVASHA